MHDIRVSEDGFRSIASGRREAVVAAPGGELSQQVYRDALRRRVCAVCLDGADDGRCALGGNLSCPMIELLPELVAAIEEARARQSGYPRVVEARVCSRCSHRDHLGLCALRRQARCALWLYLPLVAEAVAEAESTLPRPA